VLTYNRIQKHLQLTEGSYTVEDQILAVTSLIKNYLEQTQSALYYTILNEQNSTFFAYLILLAILCPEAFIFPNSTSGQLQTNLLRHARF